jgi:hypothetical protein
VESETIRAVEPDVLDRLIDKTEDLVTIFYDPAKKKHLVTTRNFFLNKFLCGQRVDPTTVLFSHSSPVT